MAHIPYYGEDLSSPTSNERKKQMASKNGFEIRAEVLEMAKDYMDKQIELNKQYASKMMDLGNWKPDTDWETYFKMYTPDELLKKAQEFYSFVEKKD